MKVDPVTARFTPISDILIDIEYMEIEERYGKQLPPSTDNKK